MITLPQLSGLETVGRGKYLVPSDKVIGVVLNGVVCAYPLRVLVWHEVVNDTVAGVPVAICTDNTTVSNTNQQKENALLTADLGAAEVTRIHAEAREWSFIQS